MLLSLRLLVSDKVIVHGNARMRSIPFYHREIRNSRPYLRPIKVVRISSFGKQNDEIVVIKKKYEDRYPDLKNISNLSDVLDCFLNNNIKLSKDDKLRAK